eukprot:scaffold25182_cov74-Attheya_sp.AAC.1
MGSFNAPRSCGWNPRLLFGIQCLLQICPPFCVEFIAFISIRIDSIDASRPCGSNAGIFIEFGRLIVEI